MKKQAGTSGTFNAYLVCRWELSSLTSRSLEPWGSLFSWEITIRLFAMLLECGHLRSIRGLQIQTCSGWVCPFQWWGRGWGRGCCHYSPPPSPLRFKVWSHPCSFLGLQSLLQGGLASDRSLYGRLTCSPSWSQALSLMHDSQRNSSFLESIW